MPPGTSGIAETILYVEDVVRTGDWYERLFGFPTIARHGERLRALEVSAGRVLLLFKQGASTSVTDTPGGTIPSHDGSGPAHIAFAMETSDAPAWERHLRDSGIAVESRVRWNADAVSVYFRDPDNHLVELISSQFWRRVAEQQEPLIPGDGAEA